MARSSVIVRELSVVLTNVGQLDRGLRVLHLTDLHLRKWDRVCEAARRLLSELSYDILLLTGDIGDDRRKWRESAVLAARLLEPAAAKAPIYAVLGNHDDPSLATCGRIPATFLCNHCVTLCLAGCELRLAGVDQSAPSAESLAAVVDSQPKDPRVPRLFLTHYPSTIFRIPHGWADLVLAGHTHGGQIRIPGLGCVWPNDRIPPSLAHGLHPVRGMKLHVGAGIGVSRPIRRRINCPPEIAVLELVSRQPSGPQPLFPGSEAQNLAPEALRH